MKKIILLIALFIIASSKIYAQDSEVVALKEQVTELKGAIEGLNESYLETKGTVDKLSKLKVSGYIQSQYQVGESANGFDSFAGGNFSANVKDRFLVRRGRVKFNYVTDLTQYVLQIDATQGGVSIKDAFVAAKEPWLRMAELKAGIFDRPFGYEISYSSSQREAPERTRMSQILFPGERDLGAQIALTPEKGPLSYFNLKAGVFNGNKSTVETDREKDFIGRLGYSFPFEEEGLSIDGGFSFYAGKVTTDSTIYKFDESANKWITDKKAQKGQTDNRTYFGADMQLYYDVPVIGGAVLRGDFITGDQPSTKDSDEFYPTGSTSKLYARNFTAWAVTYVQNVGDNVQLVARYDVFDPNTKVKGSDFKAGSNLSKGDIKYSTFGLGAVYHWDANLKFTLYYDMVTNEKVDATSSLTAYKEDIKDNVLTIRAQYKF
ncbi:MAG: hypothetical protein HGB19_02225 [Chlorobiales bacterium]|jgi:hypothetical protein|nr:hypothetical protein [Chlorobiales bacterium]